MHRRKTGTSFIEVAVAATLVAALLAGVAQAMVVVVQQRRDSLYRVVAVEEAANVLEQISALSFEQLTQHRVDAIRSSSPLPSVLPAGSLRIELVPVDTMPPAKRVTVAIDWTGPGAKKIQPIRIVAWRYDLEEPPR